MNRLDVNTATILSEEILRIQEDLHKHRFDRTSDEELGILRALDVIAYRRNPYGLKLTEHPVNTMRSIPEAKINTPREYNRTHVLEYAKFVDWIKNMLSIIPREEQQTHGTMGFDFVRTFNQVAAYKHQDHEQFVIIYAAARETAGAVTSIHPIEHTEETTLAVALQPGEYLILGDQQYRNTVVALIHCPTKYLSLYHQSHHG